MLQRPYLTLGFGFYLYFSSGSEGHMACGIAILSFLLRGLSPHQGGEGSGEVAAE